MSQSNVEQLNRLAAEERIIRENLTHVQAEMEELGKVRAQIVKEMTQLANQYDVAELLGIHQTRVSRIIRTLKKAA